MHEDQPILLSAVNPLARSMDQVYWPSSATPISFHHFRLALRGSILPAPYTIMSEI